MCGIFFHYGESSKTKKVRFKKNFLKYLKRRGPDGYRETKKKNLYAIHSRLGITGNQNQPIENKDFLLLYNGEIYNDWKRYNKTYGDAQYLDNFIQKFGYSKFKNLDGEVIGVHDGIINFTIGQRKGIKVSDKEALYVIQIDSVNNEIIVGSRENLGKKKIFLKNIRIF